MICKDLSTKKIKNWGYLLLEVTPDGMGKFIRHFTTKGHVKNSFRCRNISGNNTQVCVWDVLEDKPIWQGRLADYTKDSF